MEISDNLLKLDVSLYGNAEPITDTLSKCRVRIFYKGLNRNRTFISDEFANQLIASLPYAPVKGIFDKDGLDFGDHGENNSDGRIYGLVAANPNFAWERHLDPDGVEREYACADVILYTALYPEAKFIPEKSQSMEIHRKGLKGEWKVWNEDQQPYFHFLTGHLLGLQTLGDEVEPCFEGSAFYSLKAEAEELIKYAKKTNEKEESKVEKNIFRLSDNNKCSLLFDLLNNDADSCKIVCGIFDEYAYIYDAIDGKYLRVNYSMDGEKIVLGQIEECYVIYTNENEMNALNSIKEIGTYFEIKEKFDEQNSQIEAFTVEKNSLTEQLTAAQEKIAQYEAAAEDFKKDEEKDKEDEDKEDKKNEKEKNSLNEEVQEEIESYKAQLAEKDAEIARLNQLNNDITNEKSELESYKKSVDKEKKASIIKEFATHLSEDQIADFNSKMDNFSIEDFKKEVCFAAYNSDASILSNNKKEEEPDLIYKNSHKDMDEGALKLLNKHKNKGGNK